MLGGKKDRNYVRDINSAVARANEVVVHKPKVRDH